MANSMELNKAAQARSDAASQAARDKCKFAMTFGTIEAEEAIKFAAMFDLARTMTYVARFYRDEDRRAFIEGICAIHGAIARSCLERKESPDNSPLIAGGAFGGLR